MKTRQKPRKKWTINWPKTIISLAVGFLMYSLTAVFVIGSLSVLEDIQDDTTRAIATIASLFMYLKLLVTVSNYTIYEERGAE